MTESEKPDYSKYLPGLLRKSPKGRVVLATFFDDSGFVAQAFGTTEEDLLKNMDGIGQTILNYELVGKGNVRYELATITKRFLWQVEYELTELGTNGDWGFEKAIAALR